MTREEYETEVAEMKKQIIESLEKVTDLYDLHFLVGFLDKVTKK